MEVGPLFTGHDEFLLLGTKKNLYKMVCLSVGPLRHLIFGGFDVLWSIAWPVSDLIKDVATSKNFATLKSSLTA